MLHLTCGLQFEVSLLRLSSNLPSTSLSATGVSGSESAYVDSMGDLGGEDRRLDLIIFCKSNKQKPFMVATY